MIIEKIDGFGDRDNFVEIIKIKSFDMEMRCHGCAQVVVQTFLDTLNISSPLTSMAASPFAAGMSMTGNNCGALIGALMVLGLEYGRKDVNEGIDGIIKGVKPMRRLIRYFEGKYGDLNCINITRTNLADTDKANEYFENGGLEKCANIIADCAGYVAGVLYDQKNSKS